MGFWIMGFIDHLEVVTINNYIIIIDLHTLKITTAGAKFLPACNIFTARFLVTASNDGYSSASVLNSSLSGSSLLSSNCPIVTLHTPVENYQLPISLAYNTT
jgi:hypothetical protein